MNLHRLFRPKPQPNWPTFALLFAASILPVECANAEIAFSFYSGKSVTHNGDLDLRLGSTKVTVHDVSWRDESFQSPIYYGARLAYWFDEAPNWGLSIDFTHAKTDLEERRTTRVSGIRNGIPVNGYDRIKNTISSYELSHGLNMVTFNAMYRWFATGKRDDSLLGRLQFYTGLGAGFSVPHVEADIQKTHTYEYQAGTGPVINGMLGFNYDFTSYLSGFGEYKLSYNDVTADLKTGGSISAETVTHQFAFGLTARFDPW